MKDVIYDIETYPNICTFAFLDVDSGSKMVYEISSRQNDLDLFLDFCRDSVKGDCRWVGFNNLGFDYVVIHWILEKAKKSKCSGSKLKITANQIYKYAMKVIESKRDGGYGISVKDSDIIIKQLDLFKMNHYDNKAKMTSLKLLEFNMRLDNIEDLPFPVGKVLDYDEMDVLIDYNFNDVDATYKFYELCKDAISFRSDLTSKFGFDCTNLNDSKIGEQFFMKRIESENKYAFYEPEIGGKRKMKQTKRDFIEIKDCLFDYISFSRKEFKAMKSWLEKQVITETKGVFSDIEEHLLGDVAKYAEMVEKSVKLPSPPTQSDIDYFKKEHPLGWVECVELKTMETLKDSDGNSIKETYIDEKTGKEKKRVVKVPKKSYLGKYKISETLNVVIDGFRYDYGVGGLHGSICGVVKSDHEYELWDWDVASYYPNMAISNRIYPEHLSESFCDSYKSFYDERGNYAKGTGENLAIKLGLNATYGNSNNQYSPFYDPKYTMSITVGGQLSLCMLIERLIDVCGVKLVQVNTDGFTVKIHKNKVDEMKKHVKRWESVTGLTMEDSHYSAMYVADVNSYIAIFKEED